MGVPALRQVISAHSASAPDELRAAMEELVAPLRRRGVEVVLGVAVVAPAEGADLLVERAAVAILEAIAARADVSLVAIGLIERRGMVRLTVAHDRRGGATERLTLDPHVRAAADALACAGGSLAVEGGSQFGARYTATAPVTPDTPARR
jgi:signal transduction histidine kinase